MSMDQMPHPQQLLAQQVHNENRIAAKIGVKPMNFAPSKALSADDPLSEMESMRSLGLQ